MPKERPLWDRMYRDECYMEIVRTVGYAGILYRDWKVKLQELIEKHVRKAESAAYHLLTFEGDRRADPPPRSQVMLRENVRKLAYQLLGFPPEHPGYHRSKSAEAWIPPWCRPAKEEQPKENGEPPDPERLLKIPIRSLRCRLRDARKKLAQNSGGSWAGKQAKKEIAAVEAEFRRREIDIPAEGEEVMK